MMLFPNNVLQGVIYTEEMFQNLLWFMTIFYVVVFLSGLFGNLSVIIVIVKSKGLHCAMNYYLISLAMADILIILLGKYKQI